MRCDAIQAGGRPRRITGHQTVVQGHADVSFPAAFVSPETASLLSACCIPHHQGSASAPSHMDNNSPGGRGSLPRISSADFIARDVEVEAGASRGPVDMWTWNVAHWRRVCAQEALLRDDRATASQTYVDGRPKRRAREPRVQDMGFRNPDSAPNVFTLKEWRALGGAGSEATSILLTDQQVLPPSQLSEVQSDSEVDRDVPLETGLLDPVLFDQSGQLLQGERLQAALGTLCAVERLEAADLNKWLLQGGQGRMYPVRSISILWLTTSSAAMTGTGRSGQHGLRTTEALLLDYSAEQSFNLLVIMYGLEAMCEPIHDVMMPPTPLLPDPFIPGPIDGRCGGPGGALPQKGPSGRLEIAPLPGPGRVQVRVRHSGLGCPCRRPSFFI